MNVADQTAQEKGLWGRGVRWWEDGGRMGGLRE